MIIICQYERSIAVHSLSSTFLSLSSCSHFISIILHSKMFNIVVVVIVSCSILNTLAGCPDGLGWTQAGDSCYLVSLEAMDWFTSQEVLLNLQFFICSSTSSVIVLLVSGSISCWNKISRWRRSSGSVPGSRNNLLDWSQWYWNWRLQFTMETSTNCNVWQGGMSGLVEKQSTLTGLGISQRMVRQTLRTVSGSQWVRRRGEGGTTLPVVSHTGKDTEILYTLSVKLMQFRWRRHCNSLKVYSFIISLL